MLLKRKRAKRKINKNRRLSLKLLIRIPSLEVVMIRVWKSLNRTILRIKLILTWLNRYSIR